MTRRNSLKWLATSAASLASAALFTACGKTATKTSFVSTDITGADYARDFALSDQNGVVRHIADFKGKVVVVFFGYTQCPDVCPTTMAELAEVKKSLGSDGGKLQAVFVTLDPDRDKAAMLKAYVENFDPSFVALLPSNEQLAGIAKEYKIYYKKVDGRTSETYTLDHSAGSYIYDPKGRVRLFMHYGTSVGDLTSDIKVLLSEPA
jgi:protein SCO1/2